MRASVFFTSVAFAAMSVGMCSFNVEKRRMGLAVMWAGVFFVNLVGIMIGVMR